MRDSEIFKHWNTIMAKLDRTREFGTITGDTEGRFFEQDHLYFTSDGSEWVNPDEPQPEHDPATTPKAKPGKAAKVEAKTDDQLAEQLK